MEAGAPGATRRAHRGVGLLSMFGAVACFVAMVTTVKILREAGLGTAEVMVWRMAPGIPILLVELVRRHARWWPHRPLLIGLRAGFGGLAMATYFWAVEDLSLFQNTIIQLTQPVFVALLAPLVLREQLRGRALWALPVALAGAVMVVVADGSSATHAVLAVAAVPLLPSAVRLASSLFSALAHMTIRAATARPFADRPPDAPETVVLHFTVWVTVVTTVITLGEGGFAVTRLSGPALHTWSLVASTAAFGVVGQILLSRAYAHTDAPSVSIVGYLAIPLAMLADVVVWNETVGWVHVFGTAIMAVAGFLLARGGSDASPSAPER